MAISVDEVAVGRAMAAKLGLTFPVASDPGGTHALKPFGIFDADTEIAWPSMFVIGHQGRTTELRVLYRWLADTYSERIATEEVLKALL